MFFQIKVTNLSATSNKCTAVFYDRADDSDMKKDECVRAVREHMRQDVNDNQC